MLPQLPDSYLAFLQQHTADDSYEYDGVDSWWLATQERLLETINVDGQELAYHQQLRGFAKTLRSRVGDATTDGDDNAYPMDRLAQGIAIGDNNGDVLFLDPAEGYSVWLLYLDGGDVDKLATDFEAWLDDAEREEDDFDEESGEQEAGEDDED